MKRILLAHALIHACIVLFATHQASAVTQPGQTEPLPWCNHGGFTTCAGTDIRCANGQVEGCILLHEGVIRGGLDVVEDAQVANETFIPRRACDQKVTYLFEGTWGSYMMPFGWYNAKADADGNPIAPLKSELYPILLTTNIPGDTVPLNIADDPRYAGGEVGFFLVRGETPTFDEDGLVEGTYQYVLYSQSKLNPDYKGENESWIHLLTWQSAQFPGGFYFGWEDRLNGGDNDFEDLLVYVQGLSCTTDGAACNTGEQGACAEGSMQCVSGVPQCVPLFGKASEECNALDDDCDGEVDEGDLCPQGLTCDRGRCVPWCSSSEFPCPAGSACTTSGKCVTQDCIDVTCPDGLACKGGKCVDACAGAVCPSGQVCRNGVCVDLCDKLECDKGFVCHKGVCSECECQGCDEGFQCADNRCVENSCVDVECEPGFECREGRCVDLCGGVVCPGGGTCEQGVCSAPTPGYEADAGVGTVGLGDTDGGSDGGLLIDLDTGSSEPQRKIGDGDTSCACRAAGIRQSGGLGAALALSLAGLLVGRRARGSLSPRG